MSFLADDILDAQFRQDAAAESVAIKRLLDSQHKAAQTPLLRFYGKLAFGTSDCWYWRGSRNRAAHSRIVSRRGVHHEATRRFEQRISNDRAARNHAPNLE